MCDGKVWWSLAASRKSLRVGLGAQPTVDPATNILLTPSNRSAANSDGSRKTSVTNHCVDGAFAEAGQSADIR
ncbi:hypothetical protein X946_5511 [Burkholderia sp. ABCPW 111]|nr:hypothetical protein X946_5511 [Burkholderia sp. ABCPW 111]